MTRFRKKPVEIEAFRWTGGPDQTEDPEWIVEAIKAGTVRTARMSNGALELHIETLEGVMAANPGDWIIRGVEGEIYPCKPSIFEASYEPVGTELPLAKVDDRPPPCRHNPLAEPVRCMVCFPN